MCISLTARGGVEKGLVTQRLREGQGLQGTARACSAEGPEYIRHSRRALAWGAGLALADDSVQDVSGQRIAPIPTPLSPSAAEAPGPNCGV